MSIHKNTNFQAFSNTFLTNLLIQGCGVISGIIAARLLQPEGRGDLTAIILWPSIIASVCIFGTNWALAREAGQYPDRTSELAQVGVVIAFAMSIVTISIGWFLIPVLLPHDKGDLIGLTRFCMVIFLPLNFIALNLAGIDQGSGQYKKYNISRIIFNPIYLIIIIFLWATGVLGVKEFVIAWLVANLAVVIYRLGSWKMKPWRKLSNSHVYRNTLLTGIPFSISSIITVFAAQIDKIILVSFLDSLQVGFYVAALTFASAHSSLGSALGIITFSVGTRLTDTEEMGLWLARIFRRSLFLYAFVSLLVAFLSPFLIIPLFGKAFAPAVEIVGFLAILTGILALSRIIDEGLRGMGKPMPGTIGKIISIIIIAIMAWKLIPTYGIKGMVCSAYGGAISEMMVMIFLGSRILKAKMYEFFHFKIDDIIYFKNLLRSISPLKKL